MHPCRRRRGRDLDRPNRYHDDAFQQYVHMTGMSANCVPFTELAQIASLNARIVAGEMISGHATPIVVHLIRPDYPLPLYPDYLLGHIDTNTLISLGCGDVRHYLATRRPRGVTLNMGVTSMQEEKLGLTFRETMTGGFALGETDPETGRSKGAAAGTDLALHATVTIDDLDRFLTEPDHPGGLAGSIDFAPFGGTCTGSTGVFNLFNPSGQPDLKLMVYELRFSHDGKDFYLAGQKEVRNDPVFDMWKQTTTLYTVLHAGTDKSGPVVGAGVLSLGVADLIRMLGTTHATNAASAADGAAAIARFGQFFLGQLWDSYGVHLARAV
jgi:hypothetical protein